MPTTSFSRLTSDHGLDLRPLGISTLQLNVTRLCNQACTHCHVDASPRRREMMSSAVIDACLSVVARTDSIETGDITGGAPELHPEFERLVIGLRALGRRVVVRHNLTVTLDPHPVTGASMRHLPRFFAEHGVDLVCSLPCYLAENTDAQRGHGVHAKSVESLKMLNAEGYGGCGSDRRLDLVHNRVGPGRVGDQCGLEASFRRELADRHGVSFDRLLVITNMPINRFATELRSLGCYDDYVEEIRSACNPAAAQSVMCRSLVSVGWDGTLYDCDFNQMLGMGVLGEAPLHIADFDEAALKRRHIRFGDHCFGCVCGAGSSCGGELLSA